MRWWILLLLFVNAAQAEDGLKVGVIYGFSGAAQIWSERGREGLELALEEINAAGGVRGKKLELVYEDSETNPAKSVSAYYRLVKQQRVSAVIGNVWAFLTNPLIPLAERDKVVLLSPTVVDVSVERGSPYFFSMGPRAASIRGATTQFFALNPKVKRIAIFCWEDPWGESVLKIWREVAAARGIEIVDELCEHDFGADYRMQVARIAAKKVDAILTPVYAERVLQRMREQRVSAKLLTTNHLLEASEFGGFPRELFEGVYFTDWQPSADFVARFRHKFNKPPQIEAHDSYEALRSLARALAAEGELVANLRAVHYQGVAGEIDFRDSSFPNLAQARLFKVWRGNYELVP